MKLKASWIVPSALVIFFVIQIYFALRIEVRAIDVTQVDHIIYLTTLTYQSHAENFVNDPVYGNGQLGTTYWVSSILYMNILKAFHTLTNENISATFIYYRLFLLALYLPSMYVFLRYSIGYWFPALLLAIISSYPSTTFIVSGRSFWGLPRADFFPSSIGYLLPERLYMVFLPLLLLITLQYWMIPAAQQQAIKKWHVAAIGLAIGSSVYLLHATTALGVIELVGAVALIQALRKKLPWWAVIIFTLTAVPFLVLRTFAGSNIQPNFTEENLPFIQEATRSWGIVFPWRTAPFWDTLSYKNILPFSETFKSILMLLFFGAYTGLTLFSLRKIWRDQPVYWQYVLIAVQMVLCLLFVNLGTVPALILIYFMARIKAQAVDEMDRLLLIFLSIAVLLGPFQQLVVYILWQITSIPTLYPVIGEVSRFSWLAYLPLYALAGRAILSLTVPITDRWLRYFMMSVLGLLVLWNQQEIGIAMLNLNLLKINYPQALLILLSLWLYLYPIPQPKRFFSRLLAPLVIVSGACGLIFFYFEFISPSATFLIGLTAALILRLPQWMQSSSATRYWGIALVTAFLAFGISLPLKNKHGGDLYLIEIFVTRTTDLQDRRPPDYYSRPGYLEAAEWIKNNTPTTSLIHNAYFEAHLRYFAQRAMLPGTLDLIHPVYAGLDPIDLDDQHQKLKDPAARMQVLAEQQVDYILAPIDDIFEAETINGIWYEPVEVYRNAGARVYRLDRAN